MASPPERWIFPDALSCPLPNAHAAVASTREAGLFGVQEVHLFDLLQGAAPTSSKHMGAQDGG